MSTVHRPLVLSFALAMTVAAALTGCQTAPPEPAEVTDIEELSATVTAIDQEDRIVTLRNAEGDEVAFVVGDEVRNLGQVEVGDELTVSYYRGLAAEVTHAEPADEPGEIEVDAARAAPGERPGAAAGASVSAIVTIEEVDKKRNSVTFRNADGVLRVVDVKRPEMQQFIQNLRKGDRVRVTYTEAVAVAVRPAA